MIKRIAIDGLLSFEKFELELRNLNVLIGANGSGKSNLIEVLSLLQALPTDIGEPIRKGGGIEAWLRKMPSPSTTGTIETSILPSREIAKRRHWRKDAMMVYRLGLSKVTGRPVLHYESLRGPAPVGYAIKDGKGKLLRPDTFVHESLRPDVSAPDRSATRTFLLDPVRPEDYAITRDVADLLQGIRTYRAWCLGSGATPRTYQPTDLPPDTLLEDAQNLALVVQNVFISSSLDHKLNDEFSRFFPAFLDFSVTVFGNQILLNMHEQDRSEPIPATRWSDGMIHYLCLLAILCHPDPPPLICIDEPDLGLHPDIMPDLARLIKSCAEKTQVIITTHSRDLVDEFTDDPEAVVVCERDFDGATRMERQDARRLDKWLEDYTLGKLWEKGEIGGNRY